MRADLGASWVTASAATSFATLAPISATEDFVVVGVRWVLWLHSCLVVLLVGVFGSAADIDAITLAFAF
jgi:hypothetical protein